MSNKKKIHIKISFNSPVILTFVALCVGALLLDSFTGGKSNSMFFVCYRSSLTNFFTYIRFFGHVLGHASWSHLLGNMTILLIVGPLLEEKYGASDMIILILSTAFITGMVHFILFPHSGLLGASGVVFALIILSSFTSIKNGEIPITFILVAIIYIGTEVYDGIFVNDNISNLTHIIGGVVGALFGIVENHK